MDLALLRVRFDNAFFCSGKRGSRVIWVLKMALLRRIRGWISTKKKEKLTSSLISHLNCSANKCPALFLQEKAIWNKIAYFLSGALTGARSFWWLMSSSTSRFFKQLNPCWLWRGFSVYRWQLLCSVTTVQQHWCRVQSKTITSCVWFNWLTQHSHQVGSDIPALFPCVAPTFQHELTDSLLYSLTLTDLILAISVNVI